MSDQTRLPCRPAETLPSAIWSVDACSKRGLLAYGTSDGLTVIGQLNFPYDNRTRPPHVAVSGGLHACHCKLVRVKLSMTSGINISLRACSHHH